MRNASKLTVRAGVFFAAFLAVVLGTGSAAFAAPETYQSRATGLCLDGDAGRAYTNPCQSGNSYQQWNPTTVSGGYLWIKSNATGYCLDADTVNAYTNPCGNGNSFQQWSVIRNGSYILFKSKATGYCLDSNSAGRAYVNPCNTANVYQNWS